MYELHVILHPELPCRAISHKTRFMIQAAREQVGLSANTGRHTTGFLSIHCTPVVGWVRSIQATGRRQLSWRSDSVRGCACQVSRYRACWQRAVQSGRVQYTGLLLQLDVACRIHILVITAGEEPIFARPCAHGVIILAGSICLCLLS